MIVCPCIIWNSDISVFYCTCFRNQDDNIPIGLVKSDILEEGAWYHITGLTPPYICVCTKTGPVFLIPYVVIVLCLQWFQVRGGCSCCIYWLNCWPSLLNPSIHSLSLCNTACNDRLKSDGQQFTNRTISTHLKLLNPKTTIKHLQILCLYLILDCFLIYHNSYQM